MNVLTTADYVTELLIVSENHEWNESIKLFIIVLSRFTHKHNAFLLQSLENILINDYISVSQNLSYFRDELEQFATKLVNLTRNCSS